MILYCIYLYIHSYSMTYYIDYIILYRKISYCLHHIVPYYTNTKLYHIAISYHITIYHIIQVLQYHDYVCQDWQRLEASCTFFPPTPCRVRSEVQGHLRDNRCDEFWDADGVSLIVLLWSHLTQPWVWIYEQHCIPVVLVVLDWNDLETLFFSLTIMGRVYQIVLF